jgi:DNA-binding transcriptional LysR family regulator
VRRRNIEIYFQTHGVEVADVIEMDAMISTLQFVMRSDWVAILSGLICFADIGRTTERVISPIYDPPLIAEFVVISPARRTLSTQAQLFLEASRPRSRASRRSGRKTIPPAVYPGGAARAARRADPTPTPVRPAA